MATSVREGEEVVEFKLGAQTYCIDIRYITEVATVRDITPIPESAPHVRGVMDLRGRTTSVIDPKILFAVEDTGKGESVLVFDPEEIGGAVGWVVDEVNQVTEITEDELSESPIESNEAVRGIVRQEDEFVIWVDPKSSAT